MAVLTDYLSRRGEVLVLILVVILSVVLMLLSREDKDHVARVINDFAMTPAHVAVGQAGDITNLKAENDSLRAALAHANLEITSRDEAVREVERLREMLAFRDVTAAELLAARVIARGAARPGREFKIDKGANDGLRKNLAVVTVDGLVGKVTEVAPRAAWVRPLLARNCAVSARIVRTRTDAILEWTESEGLRLAFLPFRAEVALGDDVVTSGLGEVFPSGIPVGRVTETGVTAHDGSPRVQVRPAVDFASVEEVFVVVVPAPFERPEADSTAADSLAAGDGEAGPDPSAGASAEGEG